MKLFNFVLKLCGLFLIISGTTIGEDRFSGLGPQCGEGADHGVYTCVPYYKCNEEAVVINNPMIYNERKSRGFCESYLDRCCKIPTGGSTETNKNSNKQVTNTFKCGEGRDKGIHSCIPYFKCETLGGHTDHINNRQSNGHCDNFLDVCCLIKNIEHFPEVSTNKITTSPQLQEPICENNTHKCLPYYHCNNTKPNYGSCESYLDVCCELTPKTPIKPTCSCIPYYRCKDIKPNYEGCKSYLDVCCETSIDAITNPDPIGDIYDINQTCTGSDGGVYNCVPYYKCKDAKPELNKCGSYLDVCCKIVDYSAFIST